MLTAKCLYLDDGRRDGDACLRRLERIIELLEETYRLELGVPRLRCTYRSGRAKIGIVGSDLAEGLAYPEGELGVVGSTPEPGTIHPKDSTDVDRIGRSVERTEMMVEALVRSHAPAGIR